MSDQNNAAQAAEQDPLSDEYVNAVIRQHGYGHPTAVAARLWQWIGLHGGENGVTLLIYEAHKALSKLRAEGVQAGEPVTDAQEAFATWWNSQDEGGIQFDLEQYPQDLKATLNNLWNTAWRAALASAPVADANIWRTVPIEPTPEMLEAARRAPLPAVMLDSYSASENLRNKAAYAAMLAAAPKTSAPVAGEARAFVYPPDGTESPFTVINLGSGAVQMGPCLHDGRLGGLWFGKNGQGMGREQILNRHAHHGETIAVVTFANVQGLDVMLGELLRCRKQYFPAAPAAPQASEAVCSCPTGDGSLRHPCALHPRASESVR